MFFKHYLFLKLFKYNSYNCLCFLAITSKIIPQTHKSSDTIKNIQDTIKVGNLSTSPVLKYAITTGIPKHNDRTRIINTNIEKKKNGLYSLKSYAIVFKTLNPSEYVLSFDTLPSGLSRYVTGISTNLKFLSTA